VAARASICEDPGMRRMRWWAALFVLFGLAASCAEPVQDVDRADVLSLEVGGEQASLRAALLALGREVAPPVRLRPAPQVEHDDRPAAAGPAGELVEESAPTEVAPQPEPQPTPQEEAPAPVESEWVTVTLPKDETLFHIARRHLGDANRYREIMEWNGLTEAAARRLRPGHEIRIKRSELR
jgi:nucleoid-associated protein YgaU